MVIFRSSLNLNSMSPLSGQLIVTCLMISSKTWLKRCCLIGQAASVRACIPIRACSNAFWTCSTSSLSGRSWETYCMKYSPFEFFHSLGGRMVLSMSVWGGAYLRDWVVTNWFFRSIWPSRRHLTFAWYPLAPSTLWAKHAGTHDQRFQICYSFY